MHFNSSTNKPRAGLSLCFWWSSPILTRQVYREYVPRAGCSLADHGWKSLVVAISSISAETQHFAYSTWLQLSVKDADDQGTGTIRETRLNIREIVCSGPSFTSWWPSSWLTLKIFFAAG